MSGQRLEIFGRRSSHYTRLVRIFAEELGVSYEFTPIFDLMSHDPGDYAGNPALKLPILECDGEAVFGSLNICRALAREAGREEHIFWPEDADTPLLMNAHEILAHAMSAQVDVVIHEILEKRPDDKASCKRRESLVNCLEWLDSNLVEIDRTLPQRDLSVFETGLFCLLSHLPFRNPMDLSGMTRLTRFEEWFGRRESAKATPYRFDAD